MNSNASTANSSKRNQILETMAWAQDMPAGTFMAAWQDEHILPDEAFTNSLSAEELAQANLRSTPLERRHFIARRCFQRLFLTQVLNWQGHESQLVVQHQLDTKPICLSAPELQMSFSTSGNSLLACASRSHHVGIDIERNRSVENVAQLAARFFSPAEADAIAKAPADQQSLLFLSHWTAKEAGLKALGRGIVSGLNAFTLGVENASGALKLIGPAPGWQLQFIHLIPGHMIALVHRRCE